MHYFGIVFYNSFSCPERLYVSIHAGLPRSSITLGHCPFHGLFTALLTSNSDSNSQKAQPKKGIIPQGEFEFSVLLFLKKCFILQLGLLYGSGQFNFVTEVPSQSCFCTFSVLISLHVLSFKKMFLDIIQTVEYKQFHDRVRTYTSLYTYYNSHTI